jgi:hypothetical protein
MRVENHCGRSMKVVCLNLPEVALLVAKVRVRDTQDRLIPKFNRPYAKTYVNLKNFVILRDLARGPVFNTGYLQSIDIS